MDTQSMAREMLESLSQLVRGPIRDLRGLSGGEMGMLVYLEVQKGAAPTELGRFFGITSARVTNALNSLEKKGYVLRQPVPGDRRRVLVNVTEAGSARVREHLNATLQDVTRLMDAMGEKDAREFLRLVKRGVQLYNDGVVSAPPPFPVPDLG